MRIRDESKKALVEPTILAITGHRNDLEGLRRSCASFDELAYGRSRQLVIDHASTNGTLENFIPHPGAYFELSFLRRIGQFDLAFGLAANQEHLMRALKVSAPTEWDR